MNFSKNTAINNNTVFIADMDGTLTPARLPMTRDFADFLEKFIEQHPFYIISGSDLRKLKEQVPQAIIDKCAGLYCTMGNEFYRQGTLVYHNDFTPEKSMLEKLEEYRKNTLYPGELYGNYIERRSGMVNFSILGRDCPQEARALYKAWDNEHQERKQIAEELGRLYPTCDISIGGNISIDIVPHGFGKEQVATKLRSIYPKEEIVFIGDRTQQGGNDYSLAQELLRLGNSKVVAVDGPEDTLKFLKIQYCK